MSGSGTQIKEAKPVLRGGRVLLRPFEEQDIPTDPAEGSA
jgi:hypothetical protein